MKSLRCLIFLFGIVIVSCSNDNENAIQQAILGKWNWIESYGGFTGNMHYTPEKTGEERQLIFKDNGAVYLISNTDTVFNTNYLITKEKSILFGDEFDFLTINYRYDLKDTIIYLPMRYIIRTISDELVIDEDVYDGLGHRYKRI